MNLRSIAISLIGGCLVAFSGAAHAATMNSVRIGVPGRTLDNAATIVSWPQHRDNPGVFSMQINDPENDFAYAGSEEPPSLMKYPPIDITSVSWGVDSDYLYVRFGFSAAIPETPQTFAGHAVAGHSASLDIIQDGNLKARFLLQFPYGEAPAVPCALYDFGMSEDFYSSRLTGEMRGGGPGCDYAIVRFDMFRLKSVLQSGQMVSVECSAEAKSGQYRHFAFDKAAPITWTIP